MSQSGCPQTAAFWKNVNEHGRIHTGKSNLYQWYSNRLTTEFLLSERSSTCKIDKQQ